MFSNVTLLYFVLLIPLAGFIAWAGDYIGHRTGKRRQSLFGLRPRHTALVFTIASGMAIALASFVVFWVFSESFRVIIRDGEALYRNNLDLKEDNRRQAQQIGAASAHVDALKTEAARFDQERKEAEDARNKAFAKEKDAERQATQAQEDFQKAQANYAKAQADLANARADLKNTRGSLTTTERNLTGARAELKQKTQRVSDAEKRLADADDQVKAAERGVAAAKSEQEKVEREARLAIQKARVNAAAEIATVRGELDGKRQELADLRKQRDEQDRQYKDLAKQTEAQRTELNQVSGELVEKRREYDTLVASTNALRARQITYQVGEEVDRIEIKPGMNVWRIQYVLEAFLTGAAKKAEARGAARGREERAVRILPRLAAVTDTTNGGGPRVYSEDDALNAAANEIRRANQDMLVLAVATTNAVAGEPVGIELRVQPNPVVLKKDAVIGELMLNGDRSRQEIADAVYTFLLREVHHKLVEAGMVPPAHGGDSAGDEFSLTGEQWFKLMDDIHKAGARPKVTVHAARDLRAGDAVSLRFSVRATVAWNNPPPVEGDLH